MSPARRAFIEAGAIYLTQRSYLLLEPAREYVADLLDELLASEEIAFGDERYDWTEAGARTLVDEDLDYWEIDPFSS